MLSLPFLAPQDVSLAQHADTSCSLLQLLSESQKTLIDLLARQSHELWFGPSNPYRSSSQHPSSEAHLNHPHRRTNAQTTTSSSSNPLRRSEAFHASRTSDLTLSTLQTEERNLRARKTTIACFGSSWIRPAGCAKTMLGMKEEEAEREEALAALAAEQEAAAMAAAAEGMTMGEGEEGGDEEGMERDLDDEIPDADAEEGLVEEGEEGLEEDEEGYMERDLDDEIPEGYPNDGYGDESGLYAEEVDEDFDNQPDLDADVPEAEDEDEEGSELDEYEDAVEEGDITRDLDDDIPDADADQEEEEEGEWQHTDTEDEYEDEENEENEGQNIVSSGPGSMTRPRTGNFRTSTPNRQGLPTPPFMRRPRPSGAGETEAQRRFINRWSGGGDAFDSSSMLYEEDDLRASMTSQGSGRPSGFGRRYPRRIGGPRDSLN
ncbi:Uncharacterized protein PECH_004838 [Penicillium ucsense]|uniref:Uncharacterized protein n=1 Tax=Penicillium ucsense TaxID=2839758 RepID=A0A8J8W9D5_9EURO|nr:Uncharacterized protein PECM_007526 [Penicillium ucsense]KAF7739352.1 Uncharacterized protein PECH_004838 [Penicillium ucsense]